MQPRKLAPAMLAALLALAAAPVATASFEPPPGPPPGSDCPVGYNYNALLNLCIVHCSDQETGGCAGLVSNACIPVIGDVCVPFFFTVDPNACHFSTVDPTATGFCRAPYVEAACGSHETPARPCVCLTEQGTPLEGIQSFWVCSIVFSAL